MFGSNGTFSWALANVTANSAMLKDLMHARKMAFIDDVLVLELERKIKERTHLVLGDMLTTFGDLTRSGQQMVWIDDDEFLKKLTDVNGGRK